MRSTNEHHPSYDSMMRNDDNNRRRKGGNINSNSNGSIHPRFRYRRRRHWTLLLRPPPVYYFLLCLLLLLLLLLLPARVVRAKKVSGEVKLSGVNTEKVLTTFAVLPEGARVTLTITTDRMYANERFLKLRVYRDTVWKAWLRATTCAEKVRLASKTRDLSFNYADGSNTNMGEMGRFMKGRSFKGWTTGDVQVLVMNFVDPAETSKYDQGRAHYWYFVVDDCSLEEYFQDNAVPTMHYELEVFNHLKAKERTTKTDSEGNEVAVGGGFELTHFSADEQHLILLHTVTVVGSGIVAMLLVLNILLKLSSGNQVLHLAVLWVTAAVALDAAASLFELIHLKVYEADGVGSYAADAAAAHGQAACDALVVLLLLSLGAGWTLPTDVVAVTPSHSQNCCSRLCAGLAFPITSLLRCNCAGVLGLFVLIGYAGLAQWGRTYNDDFESYHDYEHLPGRILTWCRVALGCIMGMVTLQTRQKCQVVKLQAWYGRAAFWSFCWFQSMPFLVWICNTVVPYHMRHPVMCTATAVLQSSSLLLCTWLVTSSTTTYHRYSRMSAGGRAEQSLTDSLAQQEQLHKGSASPPQQQQQQPVSTGKASSKATRDAQPPVRTWKLGKAKIRLD